MGREDWPPNRSSKDYLEQLDLWFELNDLGGLHEPWRSKVVCFSKTTLRSFMQNSPFLNPFPTFIWYVLIYNLNLKQVKFPVEPSPLV